MLVWLSYVLSSWFASKRFLQPSTFVIYCSAGLYYVGTSPCGQKNRLVNSFLEFFWLIAAVCRGSGQHLLP